MGNTILKQDLFELCNILREVGVRDLQCLAAALPSSEPLALLWRGRVLHGCGATSPFRAHFCSMQYGDIIP